MKNMYVWILPFCMLMAIFAGRATAVEKVDKAKMLADAWEEYGFQNWDKSRELFLRVMSGEPTDDQKLQARVGIIFIQQYRAPGQDHEGAILAYQSLIKELPEDDKVIPFLLFNMGYAYVAKQTPDMAQARVLYLKALSMLKDKKAFLAQQTMLRYLETFMTQADMKLVTEGVAEAKRLTPLMDGGPYASIAHGMAASFAFLTGDERYEVEELIKQYEAGISSRSVKEGVLFKIARIYETVFKDYKSAAKYYRLFSKEIPTSNKTYFCKIRAKELENGIIDSEILKGSILKKRELQAAEAKKKAEEAAKKKMAAAKAKKPSKSEGTKSGSNSSDTVAKDSVPAKPAE